MAKIHLTDQDRQELVGAYQNFFGGQKPTILNINSSNLRTALNKNQWVNASDFLPDLLFLTEQKDIRRAYDSLTKAGPEEKPSETVPTGKLEELEKERLAREAAQKEAAAVGKEEVAKFIAQNQQKIAQAKKIEESLKDKVIYIKVDKPEAPKLSEQEQQVIETLKEAAKNNRQQLTADLADEIKARIEKTAPKEITPEEIDFLAKQAAFETVKNLIDPAVLNETIVLGQIATTPKIASAPVQETAAALALPQAGTYQTSREVVSSAFGENFAFHLLGPKDFSQIKITLSAQPIEGGQPFNLQQIPQKYSQSLERQNSFLAEIKDFSQQEIKSQLLSRAGVWLDSQVSKLPVESTLAKLYSSSKIQATLSLVGLGKPIAWVGTTTFGKIAVGTGFGPAVGWLGKVAGINFGVAEAAAKIAPAVGKGLAKVGAGLLAKTGLSAAFAQIGTALGSWAPIIGNIIGAAIGWLIGKIAEKIPWDKVKKAAPYIIGLLVGIPTAILLGPVVGVVAGVGTFALLGGIGLGGIGLGVARFFGSLGGVFIVTIGTPVIITLIAFPVVVALILFIINSGAYLVPPLAYQQPGPIVSPYIGVTKTPNPPGPFANSSLPLTVEYTITVTAKKGTLTNINFQYECRVTKENSSPPCPDPDPEIATPSASISPSSPFTFTYKQTFQAPTFEDTIVTDTFIVTADTLGAAGTSAAASASIIIGNPPAECPSDWPVYPQGEPYLRVTQGPHTRGGGGTHSAVEAIDIFSPQGSINNFIGHSILATHTGKVYVGSGGNYGRFIDVTSTCVTTGGASLEVTSRYAHLSGIPAGVITGRVATKGQTIGYGGNSGTADAHLHYEFRPVPGPIPMDPPYLPVSVPDGCMDWTNRPCNIQY